jgi:hypothetical protein
MIAQHIMSFLLHGLDLDSSQIDQAPLHCCGGYYGLKNHSNCQQANLALKHTLLV